jgi:hypothetical protein
MKTNILVKILLISIISCLDKNVVWSDDWQSLGPEGGWVSSAF